MPSGYLMSQLMMNLIVCEYTLRSCRYCCSEIIPYHYEKSSNSDRALPSTRRGGGRLFGLSQLVIPVEGIGDVFDGVVNGDIAVPIPTNRRCSDTSCIRRPDCYYVAG